MKSILMSIQPKWVAKILKGEKLLEIRKRFPLNYRGWVYIYCSKTFIKWKGARGYRKDLMINDRVANGKVVARFYCDKVEEINYDHDEREEWYATKTLNDKELEKQSCLTYEELDDYLKGYGYAIHISQLEIFDKPKELGEFKTAIEHKKPKDIGLNMWVSKTIKPLTKAPQNFCYVEV